MSQPSGGARGLLSCDASMDGLLIAAGSELKGEDALILYWYVCSSSYSDRRANMAK